MNPHFVFFSFFRWRRKVGCFRTTRTATSDRVPTIHLIIVVVLLLVAFVVHLRGKRIWNSFVLFNQVNPITIETTITIATITIILLVVVVVAQVVKEVPPDCNQKRGEPNLSPSVTIVEKNQSQSNKELMLQFWKKFLSILFSLANSYTIRLMIHFLCL